LISGGGKTNEERGGGKNCTNLKVKKDLTGTKGWVDPGVVNLGKVEKDKILLGRTTSYYTKRVGVGLI